MLKNKKICKRGHEYDSNRTKCNYCQKIFFKAWKEKTKRPEIDKTKFTFGKEAMIKIYFCTGRSYLIETL